jgi:hypothetical protein
MQESYLIYPAFFINISSKKNYFILYISEPASKKQPNP